MVDSQRIRLYLIPDVLDEFRETDVSGRKVGLGVSLSDSGVSVVDFDNRHFRQQPQ